jgi:hypothetical protein
MGAKVQKRCEKRKVKRELFAYPLHFLFLFHNSLVVWEIGRLVVWEIGWLVVWSFGIVTGGGGGSENNWMKMLSFPKN